MSACLAGVGGNSGSIRARKRVSRRGKVRICRAAPESPVSSFCTIRVPMPFLKKIGHPNAAICSPTFYDGKRPVRHRISPPFWGIITSRLKKQGDPGSFRARKRVRGIKDHKVIFADPGPGRYDPPRKNTPDTGPDSCFWILLLSGKPCIRPGLVAHGKWPKIKLGLPKYARFRWQITGFPGRWTGVIFGTSRHPCDPWDRTKEGGYR